MTCERINEHLDDFVDGTLDDAGAAELRKHVDSCADCRQRIEHEHALRSLLKDYGNMATPDATYFDAALLTAAREGRRQQHKRSWLTGFGSAVAAGLAIWFVSSIWFSAPTDIPGDDSIPVVTMALAEPRTVTLVFSSASAMDGATLTVSLPDGVAVAGFEGQREITWRTSLREGKNLLPLQLIATRPTDGILMATLRHGEDDRTFQLRLDVS